jgi:hypothetical protein
MADKLEVQLVGRRTEKVVGAGPSFLKSLSGYPSSTGTMSRRMPPTFIPRIPSSKAGMTLFSPTLNL